MKYYLLGLLILLSACQTNLYKEFSTEGQNILVFASHSDDEVIGPGITIYRSLANGGDVHVIITTDGAPREFGHGSYEAAIRKNETITALGILGVPEENIQFLGYDDFGFAFDIDSDKETERVKEIIEKVDPDKVYVHAYEGGHIDHDATHRLVVNAVQGLKRKPPVFEFIEYNSYRWGEPIPDDKDRIDNEKYPVTMLQALPQEKEMKSEALTYYLSQHPQKKNLVLNKDNESLKIINLEIEVDGEQITQEDLERDEHYVSVGMFNSARPLINELGRYIKPNLSTPREEVMFLIDAEKINSPEDPLSEWDKDCDVPLDLDKYHRCQKKSMSRECGFFPGGTTCRSMITDDMEENRKNLLTLCEDLDYKETCILSVHDMIDNYYEGLAWRKEWLEWYDDIFQEDIPHKVIDNTMLQGNTYYYPIKPDEHFQGTVPIRPMSSIKFVVDIANPTDHTVYYATLHLQLGDFGRVMGLNQTRYLKDIPPRTIMRQTFEVAPPFTHPYPIYNLIVRFSGQINSEKVNRTIYYSLRVDKKKHDLHIDALHFGSQDSLYVALSNTGYEESGWYLNVSTPHNSMLYKNDDVTTVSDQYVCEEECRWVKTIDDKILRPMHSNSASLSWDMTPQEPGEYPVTVTLMDEYFVVHEKQKLTLFVTQEGATLEKVRADHGGDMDIHNLIETPEMHYSEDCEDDYLACVFYWPDMIRPLPDYDYSKRPAEKVAYEQDLSKYFNSTFEDFAQVLA